MACPLAGISGSWGPDKDSTFILSLEPPEQAGPDLVTLEMSKHCRCVPGSHLWSRAVSARRNGDWPPNRHLLLPETGVPRLCRTLAWARMGPTQEPHLPPCSFKG